MKRAMCCAVLALILAGCASAGTDFNWANVGDLRVGNSEDQAIALLGSPNSESYDQAGNHVLVWSHANVSFLSGTETKWVALKFKGGRLIEVPKPPTVLR